MYKPKPIRRLKPGSFICKADDLAYNCTAGDRSNNVIISRNDFNDFNAFSETD